MISRKFQMVLMVVREKVFDIVNLLNMVCLTYKPPFSSNTNHINCKLGIEERMHVLWDTMVVSCQIVLAHP